ncbi:hypothetical protein AnigIFM56816_009831 [Aspergillus niger]|nr:hypothetical protein AnigIFM56816_009831 [Aspergillus niger]
MENMKPLTQWEQFRNQSEDIKFVWVQFMTYIGTNLVRMIPIAHFTRLIETNQAISVPKAVLHLLPHDHVATGGSLTGSFYLRPDLTSFCHHLNPGRALVMATWVDSDNKPIGQCARSKLEALTDLIRRQMSCSVLVGFELEFVLLRRRKSPTGQLEYEPMNINHSWCSMTLEDEHLLGFLEEAAGALEDIGISVQQFHAELAPGQWEFILPPESPVKAVDTLVRARQVITSIADKHGYRATLYPRLSTEKAGTGSHVHLSLNSLNSERDRQLNIESFFAGILNHFPAIAAFTLPQDISYGRVQAGISSGGEYVAWGWENRETILRRISSNRFEIKMMDGLANPYLALCAMFAAGLHGTMNGSPLTAGPCSQEPSKLAESERLALGIHMMLPRNLRESLSSLEQDGVLHRYMGESMVSTYLAVKRCEMETIQEWGLEDARAWFISRY